MSTKLKLLETAVARLEQDPDSMASVLKKYGESENLSAAELVSYFDCSEETYCKLALCRVLNVEAADFPKKLNTLSEYTGISAALLNEVIKKVHLIAQFSRVSGKRFSVAARDKKNEAGDDRQE
jgi:hypothetical protein